MSEAIAAPGRALTAAETLARQAMAAGTLRAYRPTGEHFASWCAGAGLSPIPAAPTTIAGYLASLAATHAPTSPACPTLGPPASAPRG
jgi:hypothetical protein